ncbi:hypothetical protein D3C85_1687330 [compost metagenome]
MQRLGGFHPEPLNEFLLRVEKLTKGFACSRIGRRELYISVFMGPHRFGLAVEGGGGDIGRQPLKLWRPRRVGPGLQIRLGSF